MADSKNGPVKPPVLDLTARDASDAAKDTKPTAASAASAAAAEAAVTPKPISAKPETKLDSKPETKADPKPAAAKTEPVKPRRDDEDGPDFGFGAMLGGAALGLAAAYGLAYFGYWPAGQAATAVVDPRLAQYDKALPELRTQIQTATGELATLTQRVKSLETTPAASNGTTAAATASPDLTALKADIASLKAQLAQAPAAQPAADLSGVTADINSLKTGLTELGARVGTAESGISKLDSDVAATSAKVAAQPTDIGAVLQLPLILSGLETAFANGRPYDTELAALRSGLPDAKIPADITNAAKSGLVRGDVIAQRFAEKLPDILNGRPADPNASWQDSVGGWFRSMVALRPTSAVEGDDPEAVVSRLDAAIARRDFIAANELMGKLPAPMVAAAADLPDEIAAQANAAQLLQTLRDTAMSEAGK